MSNEFDRSFRTHLFELVCLVGSFWLDFIIMTSIAITTILILPMVLVIGGIKK